MIASLLFWVALIGIVHTYIAYPLLLKLLSLAKGPPTQSESLSHKSKVKGDSENEDFPAVTILFAAYNEESVIEQKIHSCFSSSYPKEKIFVSVASDNSTDKTHEILERLKIQYPNLSYSISEDRMGKSALINQLVSEVKTPIYIGTDANIIFSKDTLVELIGPFVDSNVHLVGGNIVYQESTAQGIASQEDQYLGFENALKHRESLVFNQFIGAEGGCYAMRTSSYSPIPPLTFMEDFYLTMKINQNRHKTIFNPKAICFEDVSTDWREEFKRKVRISIGNFQNLKRFSSLLFRFPLGFAFFSHKVLRWITPILLITIGVCSIFLFNTSPFYKGFALLELVVILCLGLDVLFSKGGKRSFAFGLLTHFMVMNTALLVGLYKYSKGISSNVWQPTKRNQQKTQ
ncbi:MAG: glycosyltransferase family 2 protein [Schleiferiaceae bacterium]